MKSFPIKSKENVIIQQGKWNRKIFNNYFVKSLIMSLRISSIDLSRNLIATYRSTLFPIKNCVEHRKCFMQFYYIHTERLNYAFPRKISHRKSAFDPFFLQILKFPMHFLYIDFLLFMIQVFNHHPEIILNFLHFC